ncbi:MAG: hypothetical protein VYA86_03025 [Candidatus Thermoplasmatota archaeon]|nr:hypothetical protein [Candidatus Thermoplasmatota archaeon]
METKAPWPENRQQAPQQVVVGTTQNQQFISGQPSVVGQQVIYVQNPKFKPETNYRHISYVVSALAALVFLFGSFLGLDDIACGFCCGILGVGMFLDAVYYGTKATWEKEHGQGTAGSTFGLIINLLIGIGCLLVALFLLADEFLGF